MGCVLRACGASVPCDDPGHASLLAAASGTFGPHLPATDDGLAFGKSVKARLYHADQPDTLAALWAIMLGDALQQGIVLDLMDLDLAPLPLLTRGLGPARRSAILRAADVYLKQRQKPDRLGLTRQDRHSLPPEEVIAVLAGLARTATEADIRTIATADLGAFQIECDIALRDLLADPDCRMPEKDRWHPAEGLSLTAHGPGKTGHLIATALLLIDDIHHDAAFDEPGFRWQRQSSIYQDLPEPWRFAILRGYRHIMEFLTPLDWHNIEVVDLGKDARASIRDMGLVIWFDDPVSA